MRHFAIFVFSCFDSFLGNVDRSHATISYTRIQHKERLLAYVHLMVIFEVNSAKLEGEKKEIRQGGGAHDTLSCFPYHLSKNESKCVVVVVVE